MTNAIIIKFEIHFSIEDEESHDSEYVFSYGLSVASISRGKFSKVISFLALISLRIPTKYIHDFAYGPQMLNRLGSRGILITGMVKDMIKKG